MESGCLESAANAFHALIVEYYKFRRYKYPDTWRALGFMNTELGEVYEVLLAEEGGWVRNHPEDKPGYSVKRLGEELGDVILMAIVTGLTRGVNPLDSLAEKLQHKMGVADTRGGANVHTARGIDDG